MTLPPQPFGDLYTSVREPDAKDSIMSTIRRAACVQGMPLVTSAFGHDEANECEFVARAKLWTQVLPHIEQQPGWIDDPLWRLDGEVVEIMVPRCVGGCARVVAVWRRLAMVAGLAMELNTRPNWMRGNECVVIQYDMLTITVGYGKGCDITLEWDDLGDLNIDLSHPEHHRTSKPSVHRGVGKFRIAKWMSSYKHVEKTHTWAGFIPLLENHLNQCCSAIEFLKMMKALHPITTMTDTLSTISSLPFPIPHFTPLILHPLSASSLQIRLLNNTFALHVSTSPYSLTITDAGAVAPHAAQLSSTVMTLPFSRMPLFGMSGDAKECVIMRMVAAVTGVGAKVLPLVHGVVVSGSLGVQIAVEIIEAYLAALGGVLWIESVARERGWGAGAAIEDSRLKVEWGSVGDGVKWTVSWAVVEGWCVRCGEGDNGKLAELFEKKV
ncbi:hypothetical protein HK096_006091 [Nowakowskiella sp. JEL0078]|nr:hypothetical protein HK096_006091 [Nowakowskiella sp. JEL0078]